MAGTLFVVATPIGNLDDLTVRAADVLRSVDLVLAEDTRRTGRLLAHIGATAPQRALHDHNERDRLDEIVAELRAGRDVALVSDAGTPLISDPGYRLVAACGDAGIATRVVPGPSALTAALAVAGLATDRVAFEGFLPRRAAARRERLEQLAREPRTIVVFISPHRAADDLADLRDACGADRRGVIARELTKLHEEVVRGTLGSLADDVADGARGELVLVVDGWEPDEHDTPDPAALVDEVETLVAQGTSTRDAVAEIAAAAGVGRRALYDATLRARERT